VNFTKKTLFWIIVLIGLAGSFYFIDEKEEANKQLIEASLRLLPFTVDGLSEFWINNIKENQQIKVVHNQDEWQLVQPLFAKGDKKAIEDFLKIIVTARKDAVLFSQPEPAKLKELGLDNPGIEMGLKSGDKEIVIVFGEKGPTLNVSYAMFKGQPEVYRVHSDLKAEASTDVYAFRDKTILDFDPMKLKRLKIVRKGEQTTVIENDNGKWKMLKPVTGKASMEKVLESLFTIKNGEIKAFIEENPSDLSAYGLTAPKLELTIYQQEKQQPFILTIGKKDRARRGYFARSNQAEKIFDVEESVVKTILLNMDKLLEQ
jgi:hypothetical protein